MERRRQPAYGAAGAVLSVVLRRSGLIPALVAVALLCAAAPGVRAQGEDQRRFAVELRLIAGDLRRLNEEALGVHHQAGLRDRLAGSLGYLGLLAREANQASGDVDPQLAGDLARLRRAFEQQDRAAMAPPLARLLARYPLVITDFELTPDTDPARLAVGRDIDQRLCMGCHLAPDPAAANPARDLFADARGMTREEFVARLMGGVRGVPATMLANPLNDEELRGLYVWYRTGPTP